MMAVFEKFGELEYWHKGDLIRALAQPKPAVEKVIEEVCEKALTGEKKGQYRLKTEYRQ